MSDTERVTFIVRIGARRRTKTHTPELEDFDASMREMRDVLRLETPLELIRDIEIKSYERMDDESTRRVTIVLYVKTQNLVNPMYVQALYILLDRLTDKNILSNEMANMARNCVPKAAKVSLM